MKRPSVAQVIPYVIMLLILFATGDVWRDEHSAHASDCASKAITAQTVQNFWARTHDHRASHAAHERQAAQIWIKRNNAEIATVWELLAEDDDANAQEASDYARELRHDFDETCGTAPTAQP